MVTQVCLRIKLVATRKIFYRDINKEKNPEHACTSWFAR